MTQVNAVSGAGMNQLLSRCGQRADAFALVELRIQPLKLTTKHPSVEAQVVSNENCTIELGAQHCPYLFEGWGGLNHRG